MSKNIVHSPVEYTGPVSTQPTGSAVQDGKVGPALPSRSTGPNTVREVTYDTNIYKEHENE